MSYRNIRIEDAVLNFYKTLPANIMQFLLDIKRALSTLRNCRVYSYQEYAARRRISVGEVVDYCESESGCTHKSGNNFIVLYNDDASIVDGHKTFTLGHELAHIILGHEFHDGIF